MALVTVDTPTHRLIPSQGAPRICYKFEETAPFTTAGVQAEYEIQITTNPVDGDSFDFMIGSDTFTITFKTTPTDYLHVAVGLLVVNTRDNLRAVLQTICELDSSVMTITNVGLDSINLAAICYGTAYSMEADFTNMITGVIVEVTDTDGVDPVAKDLKLSWQIILDTVCKFPKEQAFVTEAIVNPTTNKCTNYEWLYCVDITELVKREIYTPAPDINFSPTDFYHINEGLIKTLEFRYAQLENGTPQAGGYVTIGDKLLTNFWYKETAYDYRPYDTGVVNVKKWLNSVPREARKFCTNKRYTFWVFLQAGTWDFSTDVNGVLEASEAFTAVIVTDGIYGIGLRETAAATMPSGRLTAVVEIYATETTGSGKSLERLEYDVLGPSLNECCCHELFFYLSEFGVFEAFPATCTREHGVTVETEDIIACQDCSGLTDRLKLSGTFQDITYVYSRPYTKTNEIIEYFRQFLTASEHYMNINNEAVRVEILDFDETIVTGDERVQVRFGYRVQTYSDKVHINNRP